jgi:hypothetical protein
VYAVLYLFGLVFERRSVYKGLDFISSTTLNAVPANQRARPSIIGDYDVTDSTLLMSANGNGGRLCASPVGKQGSVGFSRPRVIGPHTQRAIRSYCDEDKAGKLVPGMTHARCAVTRKCFAHRFRAVSFMAGGAFHNLQTTDLGLRCE